MSGRAFGACAGVIAAAAVCVLPLRDHAGEAPERHATSPAPATFTAHARDKALRRARIFLTPPDHRALTTWPADPTGALARDFVRCDFVARVPGGTSRKFECALQGGEIVRVKYGHEPEIHAEAAATRLLTALGYATDHVYLVRRLRCYGCPANPFVTLKVLELAGGDVEALDDPRDRGHYSDFEWVAVERKFEGAPIEDDEHKGWAWWELKSVAASGDDVDALRLVAAFLAHWDNKEENQRLVCMDRGGYGPDRPCADPLLMINDLGATFGPTKVNLAQWRHVPVWSDRSTCTVSMRALPYGGGTFSDVRVRDSARRRVGQELASFPDAELRAWFAAARFPQFYATTDDEKDLTAWVEAYRWRVNQILSAGPCPPPPVTGDPP